MIEWIQCKLSGEKKSKHCVVVPFYKTLNEMEQKSLNQALNVLNRWDFCFVIPSELSIETNCNSRILHPNDEYFKSIDGYNELCKTVEFYEAFSEYEYMLIYQLDCWIFYDELEYWCNKGYDYIGAPWFIWKGKKLAIDGVGNGGFSLRKIQTFIDLLSKIGDIYNNKDNEDVFFCKENGDKLNIPNEEEASLFSLEVYPEFWYEVNGGVLPMGCHRWLNFSYNNFWNKWIKI